MDEHIGLRPSGNTTRREVLATAILFAAAFAASLILVSTANAQYKPTGDDGITASPKVRQMLDEKAAAKRVAAVAPSVTITHQKVPDRIAASPAVRQRLAERKFLVNGTSSTEVAAVGYRATGADGITASPAVRQKLDERRGSQFMIAPVK